jgi:hypothetical protein
MRNRNLSSSPFGFVKPDAHRRLSVDAEHSTTKRNMPRQAVEDWTVEINGNLYPLKNWNSFGFLATSCRLDCQPGDILDIDFTVRYPDGRYETKLKAKVIRVDLERQELAGVFCPTGSDGSVR